MGNKKNKTRKLKCRNGQRFVEWRVLNSFNLAKTSSDKLSESGHSDQGNRLRSFTDFSDECSTPLPGSDGTVPNNDQHETPVPQYNDLVIEKDSSSYENSAEPLSGRRIVDIDYFFKDIVKMGCHGVQYGCTLSNMVYCQEVFRGLRSGFVFSCNMCSLKYTVWSEPEKEDYMGVNTAAVASVMNIGGGFTSLQQLMCGMEIRCMSAKTYDHHHSTVSRAWEESAMVEMKAAGAEEAALARQRGDLDNDGVPFITVVADGSWAKRSYRTNYNSLSGVAAIVGYHTRKVLYFGVKNKYCCMCSRYNGKAVDPPRHACFKNWNNSSSSMEPAAIVEGFLCSVEMHGVKYKKLVADGDSSVYQKILEVRPYDNIHVEKVECRNHLLRNFCNKIKEIATDTSRDQNTDKVIHCKQRKIINSSVMRLRTAVTKAIQHRKKGVDTVEVKAKKLREDIINGPSHVFGEHRRCSELNYFCKKTCPDEANHVPVMRQCGLYQRVMSAVGALADQSRHLILDIDSNVVEHYNAAVARSIGGKRVNFCLKGSYQARCAAAVVRYNSGRSHYKLYKTMYNRSPGKFCKQSEERARRCVLLARLRRESRPKARRTLIPNNSKKTDEHYGPLCKKPDLEADVYAQKVTEHMETLHLTAEDRRNLEANTRDQSDSERWREERRIRLTASIFGKVCNRKLHSSSAPVVSELLYRFPKDCPATRYGKDMEQEAIRQLSLQLGKPIQPCGLFVDENLPFLGATPDGLIGDDGIIEIKCPYAGKDLTPEEVINQKVGEVGRMFTIDKLSKSLVIKNRHKYHYQVQGQLHITKRNYCIFVLWTPLGMKTFTIIRDDNFWHNEMESKLTTFYVNCLLPELVDPRKRRSMPLREPSYIVDAQKSREDNKELAKAL